MIIDGHAHACGPFLKGDDIVKILAETGVNKVVLVPGELDGPRTYTLPRLAELFPECAQLCGHPNRPARGDYWDYRCRL